MIYFLDADTCVFAVQGKFPLLKSQIQSYSPAHIKIPSIVKAELLFGARKSNHPEKMNRVLEDFIHPYEVISFDDGCAWIYSSIRWELEKKGQSIGPNDLLIASIVLANHGALITHNVGEFKRISELEVEDWIDEISRPPQSTAGSK